MGFELEQVKAAMVIYTCNYYFHIQRAAFNNPDRAAEYLMTVIINLLDLYIYQGIPDQPQQPAAQSTGSTTQDTPVPQGTPGNLFDQAAQLARAPAVASSPANDGALEFLRTNPQFLELRELVRTQPHLVQPLLQQLSQSNPDIMAVRYTSFDLPILYLFSLSLFYYYTTFTTR